MVDATNANKFDSLSLQEKISFFEKTIDEVVISSNEKELNKFLKTIILNHSENTYLRTMAIKVFTDCVLLNKLKVRNELTILIDEWNANQEIFLEVRRLKDLFLFYNVEPNDIEIIYHQQTANSEAEIVAESYYYLGLIEMQKAFSSDLAKDCISNLNRSHSFFKESSRTVENRIDAEFFETVTSFIIDLLNEKPGEIKQKIELLSNILLQKDFLSISGKKNPFLISFYRTLLNLTKVKVEHISKWLDFRKGFNDLFYYYSEIKNLEIVNRLNESVLSKIFSEFIEKSFVNPYFVQSLPAEISKIDARLNESDLSPEQREFLLYIKELALDADLKKKSEHESIRQKLISTFPNRSHSYIDEILSKFPDPTNSFALIEIYDLLSKPSQSQFTDSLVNSCLELQGNKKFQDATEDERNSFIASLLEAHGNTIKDQTRWGISDKGKSAGEIDIYVREIDGTPFAIIEALNLNSLKKAYINVHIDKIFKYDTTGLKQNFILVYSTAGDFSEFCTKYIEHIRKHSYKYEFIEFNILSEYEFAELKIGKAKHIRNNEEIYLYHLILNLKP